MTIAASSFRKILTGENHGLAARTSVAALLPISLVYGLLMRVRRAAYGKGFLRVNRLDKPVISVGNITAGGTGKTPVTAWIARYFLQKGLRVAVLSRGYGGNGDGSPKIISDGTTIYFSAEVAGDEPVLLAAMVPGLMVVTGHSRYQAGLLAQERLDPDIFILDDGFQHLKLHRDLNIVLLDARRPFGNGHVLPAGLLREPPDAVKDCGLVVYTRSSGDVPRQLVPAHIPVCAAAHRITCFRPVGRCNNSPEVLKPADLRPLRGVAFAGIADPDHFFNMVKAEGIDIVSTIAFPDHVAYGEHHIAMLSAAVREAGAQFLVTTEKDAAKLAGHLEHPGVPLYATGLEIEFLDEEFENFLSPFCQLIG